MKRLFVAAVMFIMIAAVTISGKYVIENCQKNVILKTSYIIENPTETSVNDFKDYWEEKSIVLSAFVNSDNIDTVEEYVYKMHFLSKNGDAVTIKEIAAQIQYIIETVAENEKLSLQSFF